MTAPHRSTDSTLARIRIEQWQHERTALRCGRVRNYTAPGRQLIHASTNRYDAALVRCLDFEREFGNLDTDSQTILLLAFREHQPHRVIAQIPLQRTHSQLQNPRRPRPTRPPLRPRFHALALRLTISVRPDAMMPVSHQEGMSMAKRFQPGDVVQLKSGGPAMTVQSSDNPLADGGYVCQWFGTGNTLQVHEFSAAQLKEAEPPPLTLEELVTGSRARVVPAKSR